jgi:positive phototaxis protein PixI
MSQPTDLAQSTNQSLDALMLLDPLAPETRQQLLRFPLTAQDSALLPLEQITEVLRVEVAEVLPIPETSDYVLGICNWRGEMLWLIDLNEFVGYASPFQPQMPDALTILVVQAENRAVGIGVQQVHDIELHDLQQLQQTIPGLFPTRFLPFILGMLPGCSDAVLDIQALTQSPFWTSQL